MRWAAAVRQKLRLHTQIQCAHFCHRSVPPRMVRRSGKKNAAGTPHDLVASYWDQCAKQKQHDHLFVGPWQRRHGFSGTPLKPDIQWNWGLPFPVLTVHARLTFLFPEKTVIDGQHVGPLASILPSWHIPACLSPVPSIPGRTSEMAPATLLNLPFKSVIQPIEGGTQCPRLRSRGPRSKGTARAGHFFDPGPLSSRRHARKGLRG